VSKDCLTFIAAYKSEYVNCFSCIHWDREDFICRESEEYKKQNKENRFDRVAKSMANNKPVNGPL